MNLTLHVWRQKGPQDTGRFETYEAANISEDMSFLEMLDQVNENLIAEGEEPIQFDHDCREGICGSCGVMINGQAHGPQRGTATCQLHMRHYSDGDEITVEPWRAAAFPVIKDLVVDRSAFDHIVEAGGYISVPTGAAPDANLIPVPKATADRAMDAAACIACGACVAACPNGAEPLGVAQPVEAVQQGAVRGLDLHGPVPHRPADRRLPEDDGLPQHRHHRDTLDAQRHELEQTAVGDHQHCPRPVDPLVNEVSKGNQHGDQHDGRQ